VAWYTRQQLILLLAALAAGAAGLGVRQWRATFPELAERLETLDREAGLGRPESSEGERPGTEPPPAALEEGRRLRVPRQTGGPAEPRPAGRPPTRAQPEPSRLAPVDLNRATAEELMRLPGLGPVLAARIVHSRESQGRFDRVDDLRRVRGIGPATLERLRPLLTVGD
jgi:competence protein ComEA